MPSLKLNCNNGAIDIPFLGQRLYNDGNLIDIVETTDQEASAADFRIIKPESHTLPGLILSYQHLRYLFYAALLLIHVRMHIHVKRCLYAGMAEYGADRLIVAARFYAQRRKAVP
jgi:hypothetical protein